MVFEPAKKNRDLSGYNALSEVLKPKPFEDRTKPTLTIWAGCGDNDELAQQIRILRFREFSGNVPDKDPPAEPEQKRKHLVDCLVHILLHGPEDGCDFRLDTVSHYARKTKGIRYRMAGIENHKQKGLSAATMGNEIKTKGRPPKNGGETPEHFARALMILYVYQNARSRGEKHSAAIREVVENVRHWHPEMPISETEVKRVLSEFQPQHCPFALRVDCSILEGEEAAKIRSSHAQMLELAGTRSATEMGDRDARRRLYRFRFGFDKHPHYPRHNAKTSNP